MAKWRLTDGNDLYESVDLVLLPAGFRTVTVQSSVVQNDGLLITYFDRERLTTAIVGISGTLSSSENNVLLPYVFFLLPDDKVRDVQVMFQVWCVQLCPSQFVIYVPQGKVSHALNACWRASVGAHHTAASKVCIHILLQIKKLVYVKKKEKKQWFSLDRQTNGIAAQEEYYSWSYYCVAKLQRHSCLHCEMTMCMFRRQTGPARNRSSLF